jgi:hypothetical protein
MPPLSSHGGSHGQPDKEVVPLQLPKTLIQEYRRIAKAEGLTGSEVVAWCLGYGYRAYAAGDRPSAKAEIPGRSVGYPPPDESGT